MPEPIEAINELVGIGARMAAELREFEACARQAGDQLPEIVELIKEWDELYSNWGG